jgi:biotin synthase
MPNLTPAQARGYYCLYEGKPCLDEAKEECKGRLLGRVESIGHEVAFNP